jgi:zinc protease
VESKSGILAPFAGLNSYGLEARCFSKDIEFFMDILADCRRGPVFPKEEIAKCKTVQVSRIEQQHESPFFLGQEAVRQALFAGHPYRLNTEGTRESVLAITPEDLRRLHAETTSGSNIVLAVFGNISADKARELAEKFMGKIPTGTRPEWNNLKIGQEPSPPPDKNKTSCPTNKIELKAPREQTIVLAAFPGLCLDDKRIDALDILLQALNGLSSDLMINVRDKKGLAYYTGAYHRAGFAGGQLVIYSGTRAEGAEEVRTLIEKEIERISGRGIRADEFKRARMQIISENRQNRQDNGVLARECALNELYGLGYAFGLEKEKRLALSTPDDARKVAAEIMREEKMVEVVVKPGKENAE